MSRVKNNKKSLFLTSCTGKKGGEDSPVLFSHFFSFKDSFFAPFLLCEAPPDLSVRPFSFRLFECKLRWRANTRCSDDDNLRGSTFFFSTFSNLCIRWKLLETPWFQVEGGSAGARTQMDCLTSKKKERRPVSCLQRTTRNGKMISPLTL